MRRSKKPQVARVVKYRPYPKYPFPRVKALPAKLSARRVAEEQIWARGGHGGQLASTVLSGVLLWRAFRAATRRGEGRGYRIQLGEGDTYTISRLEPPR